MEIFKILGNTFCINTGMSYIPFYKVNDFEIVMLDSGWAEGERDGIDELLNQSKLKVVGIINSHSHIDHAGCNQHYRKKDGAITAMSTLEAMICESTMAMKAFMGGNSLEEIQKHYGDIIGVTDIKISKDQDSVIIANTIFKIVHTPGHSAAHIAIITPDNVIYVGDAMISYEVMEGAKMPYAFVMLEYFKSMKMLATLPCQKFVVAHKGIYDKIGQLVEDNIKFFMKRAEHIRELIITDMTQEEILNAVIQNFKIRIKSIHYQLVIEKMMISFLDYLVSTNQIEVCIKDGFIKYKVINV